MNNYKPRRTIDDGMTEQQRMEKYNERNYPSRHIRYGSGKGRVSPYPKTDPRSKAYYDQPIKKEQPDDER